MSLLELYQEVPRSEENSIDVHIDHVEAHVHCGLVNGVHVRFTSIVRDHTHVDVIRGLVKLFVVALNRLCVV